MICMDKAAKANVVNLSLQYKNEKTYTYLKTSQIDHPVGLQLFGFSAQNTVKAVQIIQNCAVYDILDLNFGCPVPKVTRTGAGSAWLKEPELLEQYAAAVVQASSKPVTAKIRLGWDSKSINVFEVTHRLERARVSAVAIHCRTKEQGYAGKADYSAIKGLRETVGIPLAVSGDIFTLDDAIKSVNETNADFVMVARGGVGNPKLITQINTYFETGEKLPDATPVEQLQYAREFSKQLIGMRGEAVGVRELRGLLPPFFRGFPGYKKIRNSLAMYMTTLEDLENIFHGVEKILGL